VMNSSHTVRRQRRVLRRRRWRWIIGAVVFWRGIGRRGIL
jgi:hypothetical protein